MQSDKAIAHPVYISLHVCMASHQSAQCWPS